MDDTTIKIQCLFAAIQEDARNSNIFECVLAGSEVSDAVLERAKQLYGWVKSNG